MSEETVPTTETTATAASQTTATPPAGAQTTETPADQMIPKSRFDEINKELKALRAEKEAASSEAQKAKEKQMVEQAQWQQLAEERGKTIDGYKAKADEYDKLAPVVAEQLKAEIDQWPEKVKGLFPTAEMPVNEMLEWAKRFRPLAQEMMGTTAIVPGNGTRPKAVGMAGATKAQEDKRAAWQKAAAHRYR
ncbi:MAG: hypothetical protein DMF06_03490 [Verrucomicrobia bacterium]|nr:MAG: hypothetical protein DMF06_03490 [Verrucomicrobiota bacterium]